MEADGATTSRRCGLLDVVRNREVGETLGCGIVDLWGEGVVAQCAQAGADGRGVWDRGACLLLDGRFAVVE